MPADVAQDALTSAAGARGAGGKVLGDLYKSTGNEAVDALAFLHMLERLKLEKRAGWVREGVKKPESVSDHMCRMAIMAMMVPSTAERPLDIPRCVMMALVHDLAEAYVGDFTPLENVPGHVKAELEAKAIDSFLDEMLSGDGNAQARARFRALWEEYEARETPESKLVKDLDRLELALQGVEYERSQGIDTLHPFFGSSIPHLEHPSIRKWGEALMEERKALWEERGRGEEEQRELRGARVGAATDAKKRASGK
ncbi:hypothetical protein CC85DRAFT_285291 [Cutaneotrichosporon oleaginosum]|uniref:5'-deoxynucleotidase n=1 Tax=Cutaneotrichosporon oleaginosum TaxID=879819 RepID=A0A0J0XNP6_9TREE|nr:uncharacterized protein CC85DRAFT_285291 [Cutaneotrichosporon oleaginosum]KLT42751.1 hypothetical protein CC85DRAFT_285291 [Cutaneotrichosporon oleaginosum]